LKGHELWRTDGTDAGTSMVYDLNPRIADSWPGVSSGLIEFGGALFFEAYHNATGYELWKTDGTLFGTTLVKDIGPGMEDGLPLHITEANGTLFFRADNGVTQGNRELWKTDGTADGTVMIKDINPNGHSFPGQLRNLNGTLYFVANDGTAGAVTFDTAQ
jgi:ELWxxDGT repeat protein